MLRRLAAVVVRERLRRFPAVALVGPRQCGKTTLARRVGGEYFDLEQPGERVRLDLAFDRITAGRRLVVLDEAQEWPELFGRLRGAIDARRRDTGRFLLLGSVSPSLMTQVSESLAGRLAMVELTPLLLMEAGARRAERLWRCGGFPDGVLDPRAYPTWHQSYLALMAQRDLPNWGLPARPATTERLFRMTAALHGSILNLSQLGQSLGLSYHTVESYLGYLEGAYLIRRLPPLEAKLRKRLVKAPRLYWRDSGLLHALLGLRADDDLHAQPWVGASWEGWIIEQILATRRARGEELEAWFFRAHDGHELDLVIDGAHGREAIEIKLASHPAPADLARLEKSAALIGADRRVLLSRTSTAVVDGKTWSVNLRDYLGAVA